MTHRKISGIDFIWKGPISAVGRKQMRTDYAYMPLGILATVTLTNTTVKTKYIYFIHLVK